MFVIVEYIPATYEIIKLVGDDGIPRMFGSKFSANKYAEDNCAWKYKVVEL